MAVEPWDVAQQCLVLGEKEAQIVTSVRFSHTNSVLTVQVVKIETALSEKSCLLFFFFFPPKWELLDIRMLEQHSLVLCSICSSCQKAQF